MLPIETRTFPINGKKKVEQPLPALAQNFTQTIAQPSVVKIEELVRFGQLSADTLLQRMQPIIGRAGAEVHIMNDITLQETADGSRTLILKRSVLFQKDPT